MKHHADHRVRRKPETETFSVEYAACPVSVGAFPLLMKTECTVCLDGTSRRNPPLTDDRTGFSEFGSCQPDAWYVVTSPELRAAAVNYNDIVVILYVSVCPPLFPLWSEDLCVMGEKI